jgi:repressor LexA
MDQIMATKPSKTVLVKVRGDSMVDAGVFSGDIAVVETGAQAIHGDIVVAEIDGSHTIKEFRMSRGHPCLVAHGPGTGVVAPKRTLNVIGVVRGVVRSYKPLVADISKRGASR